MDKRAGRSGPLPNSLRGQGGDYVGEDVLDLVPHGQKNHDDDDRNKNQDQRVLHHSLAALTNVKTMPCWQLNLLSRDAERDYSCPFNAPGTLP